MLEIVKEFERHSAESKYAPLMDGRIFKVGLAEMGHKSEKNLGMAIRAFAKRKHVAVKIQTGKGYVVVQAKPF